MSNTLGPPRPATREDLLIALGPPRKSAVATTTTILRESHYRIIRLHAMGLRNFEICDITGYSESRVSLILSSPAAKEQTALLRREMDAEAVTATAEEARVDLQTRRLAKTQRLDALLAAEATGEFLPMTAYNAIISDLEDRYGTPRKSTNVNLHADFASDLEAAIARSEAVDAARGTTLPSTVRH